MSLSREYRDYVADAFSAFGEVTVRPMFGGAGIYSGGTMFGLVTSEEGVYLKADDTSRGRYEAEGLTPFTYEAPKGDRPPTTMPYWRLPDRLLDDPEELADWARIAYAVAVRTARPKNKPKKKTSKRNAAPTPK